MAKKIIRVALFTLIILSMMVYAVEWSPQGNMNLKDRYGIYGATTINATTFYQNGTEFSAVTNGSGLNLDGGVMSVALSYFQSRFIELADNFGGDVSGTYDSIVVSDDSHLHDASNITGDNWIEDSQEGSLDVNSADYWDSIDTPDDFENVTVSGYYNVGGVRLNSTHIIDHEGHTVKETFNHIMNRGKVEDITISKTGGLGVSWTAGEIYDGATDSFLVTDAGSGNLNNDQVNYLKWTGTSTLEIATSTSTGDDILIATFSVYDGTISGFREHSLMSESVADTRIGLRKAFPTRIISGMSVSEDEDVTNSLDVTMSSGELVKDGIELKTPPQINSRTSNLVRHFHNASGWTSDTNAEIDTANYDDGTGLTAIPLNKWVKAYFIFMNGKIGWVYPTEYYSNEAQALDASLSTMPPGLTPIPKLTAIVFQQGDTDFTSTTWQDIRPGISEESFDVVTDHGALAGLGDDDHTQYLLSDGSRGLSGDWDVGAYDITANSFNGSWNGSSNYRLESWDNITGIPHATPSNGDITHFSLADEIYDWVVGSFMQDSDIDTFTELQSWVSDKTLVNEEDVATIDADWVNTAHPWDISTETNLSVGYGISLIDDTLTVSGGTAITADAGGVSVTAGAIGDTQLQYDTGQHLTTTSTPTFATLSTGQGQYEIYAMNQDVESTDAVTFATIDTGHGSNELYAMNQDVESTDAVSFATIDTGHGSNELYAMNQDVESTDAVSFATIDTGHGSNELYDMNQNVLTTSDVTFNNATVETVIFEVDSTNHRIYDNASCIFIVAGTTSLEICE